MRQPVASFPPENSPVLDLVKIFRNETTASPAHIDATARPFGFRFSEGLARLIRPEQESHGMPRQSRNQGSNRDDQDCLEAGGQIFFLEYHTGLEPNGPRTPEPKHWTTPHPLSFPLSVFFFPSNGPVFLRLVVGSQKVALEWCVGCATMCHVALTQPPVAQAYNTSRGITRLFSESKPPRADTYFIPLRPRPYSLIEYCRFQEVLKS